MKKILLLVSGMSPQIVTETLYALHQQSSAWVPDEVQLITTATGKQRAELELLKGARQLSRWCNDYKITKQIQFSASDIAVIHDRNNQPLQDLRTPVDNECAADAIVEKIQHITEQPDTELHVSLAGGRKTMGYYAGYALSLFGREQDRLSHVLVSEGYESLPDFYYPTRYDHIIRNRSGQVLNAADATVWLANIPFVRMRGLLSDSSLVHQHPFSDIVERVNAVTTSAEIHICAANSTLRINNVSINVEARELALYIVLAQRLKCGDPTLVLPRNIADRDLAQEYLACYRQLKGNMADIDNTETALNAGMDQDYIAPIRSRFKKALGEALGQQGANLYQIQAGKKGSGELYIAQKPEQIHLL